MEMNLRAAADSLGISEASLSRWARQGKIPAVEREGSFVFARQEIARWARRHSLLLREGRPGASSSLPLSQPAREVSLAGAMESGGVFTGVSGVDGPAVLKAAVSLIPLPEGTDREDLLERLVARERLASTGIGGGVAIPHPRHPIENVPPGGIVTTCFLEKEVDFHAVDGKPVFVLFVMLNSETHSHLKLLSRLSFCLRDKSFSTLLEERGRGGDLPARAREIEERLGQGA